MKRIIALLLTFLFLFVCVSCRNAADIDAQSSSAATSAEPSQTSAEQSSEESGESEASATVSAETATRAKRTAAPAASATAVRAAATAKATAAAVKTTVKAATTRRQTTKKAKTTAAPVTAAVTATPTERRTEEPTAAPRGDSYCTVSINCKTALENKDKLKGGKAQFLPSDGYILHEVRVKFTPGESAFDILKRVCAENTCTDRCRYCEAEGIQYEASFTPAYQSWYVEGIHQIYEKDCGSRSGWMYRVNGTFPNYGSSAYAVSDGDRIEWIYTCDLGEDIGY